MSAIDQLMRLHVAAGVVALVSVFIPMVARKGGPVHRRAGWTFVLAMAVICATALPVAALRARWAPSAGALLFSQGALFVTLLSGASVWKGIRVLRVRGTGRHAHPLDLAVHVVMVAAGLWALTLGIQARNAILLFFGPLAVLGAVADIRYWLNPNKPRMHWFFAHMSAMMSAASAALTAFLFFGVRALGSRTPSVAMFIGPTLLLTPILFAMRRHHERRVLHRRTPGPDATRPSDL